MNGMFPGDTRYETSASVLRSGGLPRRQRIRELPVRVRPGHGDNQDHIEEDCPVGDEEDCPPGEEGREERDEDRRKGRQVRQEGRQEDDEEGHERESDLHCSQGRRFGKVDTSARRRSRGQVNWWSANGLPSVEDIDIGVDRETIDARHFHRCHRPLEAGPS
jgi:hypothetical protein